MSPCRLYITSLGYSAKGAGRHVRGHWGVGNGLRRCPGVPLGEGENRTRQKNAGADLGAVRRAAASLLKQDKGEGSIKAGRLNAALDHDHLLQVLQGFQAIKMRRP